MQLERLIKISRPRFWMYVFWPFLLGWIAGMKLNWFERKIYTYFAVALLLFVALDYFLFSANLFIYWVNDLADVDTDKYNSKKGEYEEDLWNSQEWLQNKILLFAGTEWLILWTLLVYVQTFIFDHTQWWSGLLILLLFWWSAYRYSTEPIRAKSKPFVDGIFNVLYILPSLIWWISTWWTLDQVARFWFAAAWLRAMAMHAYSAIPDIIPDQKAWLMTTAVFLGKSWTLIYCAVLRMISSYLGYTLLWFPMLLMWAIYLIMIIGSFWTDVMTLYKWFPRINVWVWWVLFWLILLW